MTLPLSRIAEAVAHEFDISVAELTSRRRTRRASVPRHVFMYLVKTMTPSSISEIGRWLDRDHTSVIHGVRQIEIRTRNDTVFRARLLALIEQIRQTPAPPVTFTIAAPYVVAANFQRWG